MWHWLNLFYIYIYILSCISGEGGGGGVYDLFPEMPSRGCYHRYRQEVKICSMYFVSSFCRHPRPRGWWRISFPIWIIVSGNGSCVPLQFLFLSLERLVMMQLRLRGGNQREQTTSFVLATRECKLEHRFTVQMSMHAPPPPCCMGRPSARHVNSIEGGLCLFCCGCVCVPSLMLTYGRVM